MNQCWTLIPSISSIDSHYYYYYEYSDVVYSSMNTRDTTERGYAAYASMSKASRVLLDTVISLLLKYIKLCFDALNTIFSLGKKFEH